jgi:DNA-binding transcriptional LysR family regulator
MDLVGVEVFVEVVDAQSFTRAARRLCIPTTTVSARVARLEKKLGVTLIQRTTRQLHVTSAGRTFYGHCVRALAALGEGEQELAAASQEPAGDLTITAPGDLAAALLTPLVERFLATHPKVRVDLIVTNRQVDLIAEGVDLAVRVGPLEDSSLIIRRFTAGHIGLWAARTYLEQAGMPKRPRDLQKHPFLGLGRLRSNVALKSAKGELLDLDLQARLSSDDFNTLKAFIQRGAGIGLLPDFMGRDPTAGLAPVLADYQSALVPVYFAYPSQRFVPHTVRAFIDMAGAMSPVHGQTPSNT